MIIKNATKRSTVIVKWQKTRFLGSQKDLVLKSQKNMFFTILCSQSIALLHFLLPNVSRPNKKHFHFDTCVKNQKQRRKMPKQLSKATLSFLIPRENV